MGCFPCFDSREEEKLNPEKESDDGKQDHPMVPPNIAKLPSGEFISSFWFLIWSCLC